MYEPDTVSGGRCYAPTCSMLVVGPTGTSWSARDLSRGKSPEHCPDCQGAESHCGLCAETIAVFVSAVASPTGRGSRHTRAYDTIRKRRSPGHRHFLLRPDRSSSATSAASCSHRLLRSDPLTPPACPPASPPKTDHVEELRTWHGFVLEKTSLQKSPSGGVQRGLTERRVQCSLFNEMKS